MFFLESLAASTVTSWCKTTDWFEFKCWGSCRFCALCRWLKVRHGMKRFSFSRHLLASKFIHSGNSGYANIVDRCMPLWIQWLSPKFPNYRQVYIIPFLHCCCSNKWNYAWAQTNKKNECITKLKALLLRKMSV